MTLAIALNNAPSQYHEHIETIDHVKADDLAQQVAFGEHRFVWDRDGHPHASCFFLQEL
jgi:hypothetical protein